MMDNSGINILMLGGKRCGKTTVLSSMCSQIDKALAGTDLRIIPKNNTAARLQEAANVIRKKLDEFNTPLIRTTVDENPTGARQVYEFSFTSQSLGNIDLTIHDIPGEWLTSNLHEQELKSLIAVSQVIIIAIDTPYLFYKMTTDGYGQYHEEYNKPVEIANFFRNSLSPEDIKDRMILFVPLKCERYYHLSRIAKLNPSGRNYMQEVCDSVSYGYKDLLRYLRSTPQLLNSLTIAVTPILSAGGIDFVKFETDAETGKVVSLYQKPEFLSDSEKGFSPVFCEQPILYTLVYVMKLVIDGNNSRVNYSFFGARKNTTLLNNMTTYETLRKKMKTSNGITANDGYYIIQNPKKI